MDIRILNPVEYHEWDHLLLKSGDQSFFHTSAWAKVLGEGYSYHPVYFAVFKDERLSFLMPFMEVASPFTGRRGVSLPFTDFCGVFSATGELYREAIEAVVDYGNQAKWRYAEWRGADVREPVLESRESYYTHNIDLDRAEEQIFASLSTNNRRNIKKAILDGIRVEFEVSPDSTRHFYRLNCITRKHHGLPPQPFSFFEKIHEHIISQGYGTIAVAKYGGEVAAAAVFFHFGNSAIYKYGASDPRYLIHRPNNVIMWEAAKRYRALGAKTLNLGRTEIENIGLLRFKRSWGAVEEEIGYQRYRFGTKSEARPPRKWAPPNRFVSLLPVSALRIIGRLLYRHVG